MVMISLLFFSPAVVVGNSPCPVLKWYPPLIDVGGGRIYTTSEFQIIEVVFLLDSKEGPVRKIEAQFFEIPSDCLAFRVYVLEKKSGKILSIDMIPKND